jgi:hypothetical protein
LIYLQCLSDFLYEQLPVQSIPAWSRLTLKSLRKGLIFFATFRSQKAMSKQLDNVKTTYLIAVSSVLLASGMESVGSNIGDNYKLQMSLNIIFQAY